MVLRNADTIIPEISSDIIWEKPDFVGPLFFYEQIGILYFVQNEEFSIQRIIQIQNNILT